MKGWNTSAPVPGRGVKRHAQDQRDAGETKRATTGSSGLLDVGVPCMVAFASSTDESLAAYLASLQGGLEVPATMKDMTTVIGQALRVTDWHERSVRIHTWLSARHPALWSRPLSPSCWQHQCCMALQCWMPHDPPTLLGCRSEGDSSDVHDIVTLYRGDASSTLVSCLAYGDRLVA